MKINIYAHLYIGGKYALSHYSSLSVCMMGDKDVYRSVRGTSTLIFQESRVLGRTLWLQRPYTCIIASLAQNVEA